MLLTDDNAPMPKANRGDDSNDGRWRTTRGYSDRTVVVVGVAFLVAAVLAAVGLQFVGFALGAILGAVGLMIVLLGFGGMGADRED